METMEIVDFRGVPWKSMGILKIEGFSDVWFSGKTSKVQKSLSPRSKLPKRAFLHRRDAFWNVWGGLRSGHVRVGAVRVRETLAKSRGIWEIHGNTWESWVFMDSHGFLWI
jgi:hypothetical protein